MNETSVCSLCFWLGGALQCYTCMGSTDEDCNRQGAKTCPSYSDACAVVKGHGSELYFCGKFICLIRVLIYKILLSFVWVYALQMSYFTGTFSNHPYPSEINWLFTYCAFNTDIFKLPLIWLAALSSKTSSDKNTAYKVSLNGFSFTVLYSIRIYAHILVFVTSQIQRIQNGFWHIRFYISHEMGSECYFTDVYTTFI